MTTPIIPELLPCPFCGDEPTIIYKNSPSNIIECNGDHCAFNPQTHNYNSWQDCVKGWNTRHPQTDHTLAMEEALSAVHNSKSGIAMIDHKFERAGGVWKVAEKGVELGAMSWASNIENGLHNAKIDVDAAIASLTKALGR